MTGPARLLRPLGLAMGLVALATAAQAVVTPADSSRRATTHAMRYLVSLPPGWTAARTWPVLVVVPDAGREFAGNLAAFVAARGARPYILVAPEVLSSGGARSRTPEHFDYPAAEWATFDPANDIAFDDTGVAAVLADVRARWHGEPGAFLTGWEAGGHTVWALAYRHPDRWRGVVPVTTNYQARGLSSADAWSRAAARATLAIQPLRCGAPTGPAAPMMKSSDAQVATAIADGRAHGFAPRAPRTVPGKDHGPLPEAVLAWCDSLRGGR